MPDAWPGSLPQAVLRDGNAYQIGDALLRSPPDQGPAKVRARTSAVPDQHSGGMVVTASQKATLVAFYKVTLIGGSLPFTYPDPDGGDDLLVRFAAPPAFSKIAPDAHRVTITLEVLP